MQDGTAPLSWLDVDVSELSLEEKVNIATMLTQLRQIQHPNILRLKISGLSSGSGKLVLITERLPSTTVESHLAQTGPVPLETAQLWCSQVSCAAWVWCAVSWWLAVT